MTREKLWRRYNWLAKKPGHNDPKESNSDQQPPCRPERQETRYRRIFVSLIIFSSLAPKPCNVEQRPHRPCFHFVAQLPEPRFDL